MTTHFGERGERVRERPILMSAPMVRAILAGTKTQTRRTMKPQPSMFVNAFGMRMLSRPKAMQSWNDEAYAENWCPYGVPGDRLWVRETARCIADSKHHGKNEGRIDVDYAACGGQSFHYPLDGKSQPRWFPKRSSNDVGRPLWQPSIHMPRWASRITLEITDVRVERLQEISEADALAEGCESRLSGTWWQGYRDMGEKLGLLHQQHKGDAPPDWMIEPHKMAPTPWLDVPAAKAYRMLWESINGAGSWFTNPWVWVVCFRRVTP